MVCGIMTHETVGTILDVVDSNKTARLLPLKLRLHLHWKVLTTLCKEKSIRQS